MGSQFPSYVFHLGVFAVVCVCVIYFTIVHEKVLVMVAPVDTEEYDTFNHMKNFSDETRLIPVLCNSTTFSDNNRHQETMKRRLPKALIIGAKKCGTTALLQMLRSHPLITGPGYETGFFELSSRYKRGFEWYRGLMPHSSEKEITIEKSPSYFYNQNALERIYTYSRNMKFLLILRDPIIRSISDYAWRLAVKYKGNDTPSYESIVFKNGKPSNSEIITRVSEIKVSMYDIHYENWLKLFKREQIHIVNGDKLISNPVPELKKIERFLNIPQYFNDDIFFFSKDKGFFCWRKMNRKTYPPCTMAEPECLNSHNGRKHPNVSSSSLYEVEVFLKPHIQRFCTMVPAYVDFHWCS